MENTEYEDFTALEGEDFAVDDPDLEISFLDKLRSLQVVPGITKYLLKVPKNPVVVLSDSHVAAEVVHRTIQGEFIKGNNNNWQKGRKLKLGGLNDKELLICVKTMCVGEIAYFKIDRYVLDQQEDPEQILTDVEKKRNESGKLKDGYYRITVFEETKVKTNIPGAAPSLESLLSAIQDNKRLGNDHFRNFQFKEALKEYMKGFNQIKCFPMKKAQDEGKTHILTELEKLRTDLINNSLRAAYKAKDYSKIEPLFDPKVLKDMEFNLKFCQGIAEIYLQLIQNDDQFVDVDDIIIFITRFLNNMQDKLDETTCLELQSAVKKLERYEKKFNVLQNLKHYSEKRDELEYAEKVAEKLEQRGELRTPSEGEEENGASGSGNTSGDEATPVAEVQPVLEA